MQGEVYGWRGWHFWCQYVGMRRSDCSFLRKEWEVKREKEDICVFKSVFFLESDSGSKRKAAFFRFSLRSHSRSHGRLVLYFDQSEDRKKMGSVW